MSMNRGWMVGLLGAALSIACGGSDAESGGSTGLSAEAVASVEGIYTLDEFRKNPSACDAPGASVLGSLKDELFFIAGGDVFGAKYVMLASCANVDDCKAKRTALLEHGSFSQDYSFILSSASSATTLNGFEADTGSSSDGVQCRERTYADHVLTVASNHSLHLESRSKNLANKPVEDGFCEVEPAKSKAEAASLPCAALETLDGTFLQAF